MSNTQLKDFYLTSTIVVILFFSSFLSQTHAQPKAIRRNRDRIWSSGRSSATVTMIRRHHRPGELIFAEEFHGLDSNVWEHEIAEPGRTNGEFQSYGDDAANSYVRDGILFLKPTVNAPGYDEIYSENGSIDFSGLRCNADSINGPCDLKGTNDPIVPTIASARINTRNAFGFRYGHIEVRAKLPKGDWIWPAIWLMPQGNRYGMWPMSGEIDMMESRGNKNLFNPAGEDIGCNQFGSTLHFGLDRTTDKWRLAHFSKNDSLGFNSKFHTYGLIWTPDELIFTLDDQIMGTVTPPPGGFYEFGNFTGPNIWGSDKMSPFNQPFYVILNVAVGGTSGYFPENSFPKKPWQNASPQAREQFLEKREQWLNTWNGEESALQVDYVRIWAL